MYQIFEAKRPIFADLYTLLFYIIMINKYKSINMKHDWSFQIFIVNNIFISLGKTIKDISIILIICLLSILIHYDRLEESKKKLEKHQIHMKCEEKTENKQQGFSTVWIAKGVK